MRRNSKEGWCLELLGLVGVGECDGRVDTNCQYASVGVEGVGEVISGCGRSDSLKSCLNYVSSPCGWTSGLFTPAKEERELWQCGRGFEWPPRCFTQVTFLAAHVLIVMSKIAARTVNY